MATLYVKKDGSGDALTIQQAIQLSSEGDTIEVEAGTFDENVDIWKGITLKGAGIDQTIVTGALRSAVPSKAFTWGLGDTLLTISTGNTDDFQVGRIVTASGIPTDTRVVSKTSTTLTISKPTTSATTTARNVTMNMSVYSNEAAVSVKGTNGVIRDMKFVGFDIPNPALECGAIYFRQVAPGYAGPSANGWEVFNCEFVANGEYALLTDYNSELGNLNIHDCKFSGKTFVGENPAKGDQYSVWNVPRQGVVLHSVLTGSNFFINNDVNIITGGVTLDGLNSYNVGVTFDPIGSVITGNVIQGTFGTSAGLRSRGLNSTVQNNTVVGSSYGYYILPNHALGVLVSVGTMILNSSKFWVCTQAHTSSSTNAPTGAQGSEYWTEITLAEVNSSGVYGVGILTVGTNGNFIEQLISVLQEGISVKFTMSKNKVKSIPVVAADSFFSNEANWKLVSFIFKDSDSAKRLTPAFRDFSQLKELKIKEGMVAGDNLQLVKIIISTPDRTLFLVRRSDIESPSSFDFVLE